MKNREYVEVFIQWEKEDIGLGLTELPQGGIRFCTQIKFDEEGDVIPKWTAEIIIRKINDQFSCYANIKYLFEGAPYYLLSKGRRFAIFDGPNVIAKGEILTDLPTESD